jgi:hypothetical protein
MRDCSFFVVPCISHFAHRAWGSREAGIALVADHPAVKRKVDSMDEQYKQNQLRASDEILNRWIDVYRQVE